MATLRVPATGASGLTRRHVPLLLSLAIAFLIAVVILPSALNIPQSNPGTVAEYAPVPPNGESAPGGNLSSLSLGRTGGLSAGSGGAGGFGVGVPSGEGERRPAAKRCVGDPPRQTEDPMSPPCVAIFEGDNGGSTYFGVTRDEIRIVFYTYNGFEGTQLRCNAHGDCNNGMPRGSYCDFDKPPNTDRGCMPYNENTDHWEVRSARSVVKHFNARYQTYNRHVHVWMYSAGVGQDGTSVQDSDIRSYAADNYEKIRPFAVVPVEDVYSDAMAQRNVLSFGANQTAQPNSFYRKHGGLWWNFYPDVERWARGYVDYVCSKIKGGRVAHSQGNDTDGQPLKGKPRKYAFMYTTEEGETGLHAFRKLAIEGLHDCGIQEETTVTFPVAGPSKYAGGDGGTYGATNVARLRQHSVTTILWFGGQETYTGDHADEVRYYPEIVFAGDGLTDGILGGTGQNQNWWRNARGFTHALFQGNTLEEQPGFQACKDGDPNASRGDCATAAGFPYRDFFMLFKAIQAAGPKITPETINQGLHALPAIQSTNPMLAACHFEPNDYTCVKDGVEIWWDPNAQSPFWSGPGCFHMTRGASRFLPGKWPPGDAAFTNPNDPCSPELGGLTVGFADPAVPGQ